MALGFDLEFSKSKFSKKVPRLSSCEPTAGTTVQHWYRNAIDYLHGYLMGSRTNERIKHATRAQLLRKKRQRSLQHREHVTSRALKIERQTRKSEAIKFNFHCTHGATINLCADRPICAPFSSAHTADVVSTTRTVVPSLDKEDIEGGASCEESSTRTGIGRLWSYQQ